MITAELCVTHVDLTAEDIGNYTCEIRGTKSNVLASKTFSVAVQGMECDEKIIGLQSFLHEH